MQEAIFKVWIDRETPLPPDIPRNLVDPIAVTIIGDDITLVSCLMAAMRGYPDAARIMTAAVLAYSKGIGRDLKQEVRTVVRKENDH